jgi:TPR repeat protein
MATLIQKAFQDDIYLERLLDNLINRLMDKSTFIQLVDSMKGKLIGKIENMCVIKALSKLYSNKIDEAESFINMCSSNKYVLFVSGYIEYTKNLEKSYEYLLESFKLGYINAASLLIKLCGNDNKKYNKVLEEINIENLINNIYDSDKYSDLFNTLGCNGYVQCRNRAFEIGYFDPVIVHNKAKHEKSIDLKLCFLLKSLYLNEDDNTLFEIATIYNNPKNAVYDTKKAFEYYSKIQKQDGLLCYILGMKYHYGSGTKIDYNKAHKYYDEGIELGELHCMIKLLELSKDANINFKNNTEIIEAYEILIEKMKNDKGIFNWEFLYGKEKFNELKNNAICCLAELYQDNDNYEASFKYYSELYANESYSKYSKVKYNICLQYLYGIGTSKNIEKAKEIALSLKTYKYMYARILLNEKKYDEAFNCATKLLEEYPNDADSKSIIGICHYINGNYDDAFDILVENNFRCFVMYYLGLCYYFGHGTSVNYGEAKECFKMIIDSDYKYLTEYIKSEIMIAKMYLYGHGVTKDVRKTIQIIKNISNNKQEQELVEYGMKEDLNVITGFINEQDSQTCCCCYEQLFERQVYIPCGHTNICKKCDKNLKTRKCPVCRAVIVSMHSIYL